MSADASFLLEHSDLSARNDLGEPASDRQADDSRADDSYARWSHERTT
jgi:hypothetical protein